jgi:acyl-CoA synthetase (AMP-forming)/AMP-acid ligase II
MKAAGLTTGDRLAVQVEKSAEALAIYAACVQSGVIFLPLNTAYKPAEVDYFISDSGARMLIAGDAENLQPVSAAHGVILHHMAVLPALPPKQVTSSSQCREQVMIWRPFFIRLAPLAVQKGRC